MAAGVTESIDFVGSMSNNPQNCRSLEDPSWDLGHEGHSGYLAINIANQLLEGWLRTAQPEIVMFMLGTNDVFQGRSQADILAAYTRIVELSRASNPNMKIIVSISSTPLYISNFMSPKTETPGGTCWRVEVAAFYLPTFVIQQVDTVIPLPLNNQPIVSLNQAIPAWAEGLNSTESPIYVADVYNYPYPQSDLRDGVHPNDAGDVIIADVVGPLLLSVIQESLTGSATVY